MNYQKLIPLISIKDLKNSPLSGVSIDGEDVLVVNHDGEITIFQGVCPHQGALLAEGEIQEGHIVCPAHQWKFNCASGKKLNNEKECLLKFAPIIEDGVIHIQEGDLKALQEQSKARASVGKTKAQRKLRKFEDLPGPKSWPVMGNLPSILSDTAHLHRTLYKWSKEYGSIYRLKGLGATKGIVISDVKLQREVFLDRPSTFRRIKTMEAAMEELGLNGLITAEGDLWKRYRKYATRGLANSLLRKYFEMIDRSTKRLYKLFASNSSNEKAMDIQKDLLRYSVDVTSSLAFGVDINTIEHREDTVQEHLAMVLPMVQRRMMFPVPYWRFVKAPADHKLDKSLKIIQNSINKFMSQARARIDDNPDLIENPTNFLEALLAAQMSDGGSLTDDEIYTNVFSILLAGEDSTANSIAWAVHYMTENDEIQGKIQAEVDSKFGDSEIPATFDDLTNMPYIEAVINEALRLQPVLPVVQLCANEDVVIDDVEVPKDTNIHLPIYNTFLDDDLFENSQEFRPERWFSPDKLCQETMKNAFMPFGFGPRLCPGKSLALLEAKAVLTMICRNFNVRKSANAGQVDEIFSGVMQPVNLEVTFEKRTNRGELASPNPAVSGTEEKCPFHESDVSLVE